MKIEKLKIKHAGLNYFINEFNAYENENKKIEITNPYGCTLIRCDEIHMNGNYSAHAYINNTEIARIDMFNADYDWHNYISFVMDELSVKMILKG